VRGRGCDASLARSAGAIIRVFVDRSARVDPGDVGALIRRALIRRPANPAEVRMNVKSCGGTPPALRTVMKKSTRRLALRAQTIRLLADEALPAVLGGGQVGVGDQGFIMKDSIIVQTSRR
jgi:hypothetical protein